MRLGLEFLPNFDKAAWPVFEALHPTIVKVRPNTLSYPDWQRVLAVMRRHTTRPTVILRSGAEVPDLVQAQEDIAQTLPPFVCDEADCYFEMGNEPNNPATHCSMERYGQLLSDGLALASWMGGQGCPMTVLPPGLMPQPWDVLAPWLLHPTRDAYNLNTYHVYHTAGMDGLMEWPHRQPNIVTEFGYSGNNPGDRVRLNLAVLKELAPLTDGALLFCAPSTNPEWTKYELTLEDASVYAAWNERNYRMYDRNKVMDDWFSAPWDPGQGYNEDDAFGKYLATYGEGARLGAPKGGPRDYDPYLIQFFSGGMLYVRKGDWSNVKVAYSIGGLPLE